MDEREIIVDVTARIATITLNRPSRLNAITKRWVEDFLGSLDVVESDPTVRVVVLTGAGRAFCAGADLEHPTFSVDDDVARRADFERAYEVPVRLKSLRQPLLAAINGAAAGAGISLALAADIRIASDTAFFKLGFVELGLVPDLGLSYLLPEVVGPSLAVELSLRTDRVGAEEALRLGLVSHVLPAAELLDGVTAEAARIADLPPASVQAIKRLVRASAEIGFDRAMQSEIQTQIGLQSDPGFRGRLHAAQDRGAGRRRG